MNLMQVTALAATNGVKNLARTSAVSIVKIDRSVHWTPADKRGFLLDIISAIKSNCIISAFTRVNAAFQAGGKAEDSCTANFS